MSEAEQLKSDFDRLFDLLWAVLCERVKREVEALRKADQCQR